MAEQYKSITSARKALPELSQAAHRSLERCIITNQGEPQSVLMGYREYQGFLAAVELLARPRDLANLERGLEQATKKNLLLSFEQLKLNLLKQQQTGYLNPSPSGPATPVTMPAPQDHSAGEIKAALGQIMAHLGIVPLTEFKPGSAETLKAGRLVARVSREKNRQDKVTKSQRRLLPLEEGLKVSTQLHSCSTRAVSSPERSSRKQKA